MDRYADIKPYSRNRVQLTCVEEEDKAGKRNDYINASHIALPLPSSKMQTEPKSNITAQKKMHFIATQGPRDPDLSKFWQMVFEQKVEVIIMLTRPYESGKAKCAVYYPETISESLDLEHELQVDEDEDDNLVPEIEPWGNVTCLSITKEAGTEVRELKITAHGEERLVKHFLFMMWPDYDIPKTKADEKALLELVELSRRSFNSSYDFIQESLNTEKSGPKVVHCSAGVGRTGTFIALDYLLRELDKGKWDGVVEGEEDPIFECVKKLREQRMQMVMRPAQYAFLYKILKEKWEARMQAKESGNTRAHGTAESPTKKRKVSLVGEEGADVAAAAKAAQDRYQVMLGAGPPSPTENRIDAEMRLERQEEKDGFKEEDARYDSEDYSESDEEEDGYGYDEPSLESLDHAKPDGWL